MTLWLTRYADKSVCYALSFLGCWFINLWKSVGSVILTACLKCRYKNVQSVAVAIITGLRWATVVSSSVPVFNITEIWYNLNFTLSSPFLAYPSCQHWITSQYERSGEGPVLTVMKFFCCERVRILHNFIAQCWSVAFPYPWFNEQLPCRWLIFGWCVWYTNKCFHLVDLHTAQLDLGIILSREIVLRC